MKINANHRTLPLLLILIVVSLLVSLGTSYAYRVHVLFDNRISQYFSKGDLSWDGYFFILDLFPSEEKEMNDTTVTAKNTYPDDFKDAEDTYCFDKIFLGNNVFEMVSQTDYVGQGGEYEVTAVFPDGRTETQYTDYIVPRRKPIPNPENLTVDFSTGYTTPTFSCSSVDDETVDIYRLQSILKPQ